MFWIDPVYIGDECDDEIEVVVHRCGYFGNTDDSVSEFKRKKGTK